MQTESPTNLLALDRPALESMFCAMGERRFRAQQVLQWIYQRRVTSFEAMTDLSKPLRERLARDASIAAPQIAAAHHSVDGTIKWLLSLRDNNCIESVFIPEAKRGTLCVSSQVGCGLNCTFCATARQGYNRNLSVDEIIGQLWLANRELAPAPESSIDSNAHSNANAQFDSTAESKLESKPESQSESQSESRNAVTNVVLMGMGEPLLNFDNVVAAMRLMMDDCSFGLSRRRVTLSTAGLAPMIEQLAEVCPVSLAVSLHAPTDDLRNQLVPLNKKYPIARLLSACRRYANRIARQTITFEYVLIDSVNDDESHARALARLLGDLPAKVNLIPFNPSPGIDYRRASDDAINRFRDVLLARDIFTMTRKTRGDDIAAACGQLAGRVDDRTGRASRLQKQNAHAVKVQVNAPVVAPAADSLNC